MVPDLGASTSGKKTPALTLPQVRFACAALLQKSPRSPAQIADDITQQLRRNEQARRDHWRSRGLTAPPRRWVQ